MKARPFRLLPNQGPLPPVMVYGPGVRLWHWFNALLVVVLAVSGYFIGVPPPATIGDTSTLYVVGWIRFAHLAAGYLFGLACLARLWLAFAEGGASRQMFCPPIWRKTWSDELGKQFVWHLLPGGRSSRYFGLSPLGGVIIIVLYLLPSLALVLTGFAMYAEVAGHESWQYALFGWMTAIFGNTLDLHLIHRLAMWVLAFFAFSHAYVELCDDILSRQTHVGVMLSGRRDFRE